MSTHSAIALALCTLTVASLAVPADATIYTTTYAGTVGLTEFGLPAYDSEGVFGGGILTGDSFTAQFSADFNATTLVTNTGTAIAVGGDAFEHTDRCKPDHQRLQSALHQQLPGSLWFELQRSNIRQRRLD